MRSTPSWRCACAEAIAACSADLIVPVRLTTPRSVFTETSDPVIPGSDRIAAFVREVMTVSLKESRGTLAGEGVAAGAGVCAGGGCVAGAPVGAAGAPRGGATDAVFVSVRRSHAVTANAAATVAKDKQSVLFMRDLRWVPEIPRISRANGTVGAFGAPTRNE